MEAAYKKAYLSFFARLCRFAQTYVHDGPAAENLVQNAFLQLWEKRAQVDWEASVLPFLFTLVKNNCIDYLRRQHVEKAYQRELALQLAALERMTFPALGPSAEAMESKLNKALDQLPPKCRQIFCLNRFDGKKYKEIAALMQISENTVENQMGIAIRKLRGWLLEK